MPMHYPPLADGTYRYGDPPRPLPSPIPGPDPGPTGQPLPGQPLSAGPPGQPLPGQPLPIGGTGHGPPPGGAPRVARPRGAAAAAAIVGGLALVVVVILGLALFGPGADPGPGPVGTLGGPSIPEAAPPGRAGATFTVEGRFTVVASPGEPVSGDGAGCDLPVTLSDIGEGTPVTLSEGAYASIGSTVLAYGGGDLSSCTFTFGFDEVPSGAATYLIEIPGRGQLPYTEDELRAGVDITLGR